VYQECKQECKQGDSAHADSALLMLIVHCQQGDSAHADSARASNLDSGDASKLQRLPLLLSLCVPPFGNAVAVWEGAFGAHQTCSLGT